MSRFNEIEATIIMIAEERRRKKALQDYCFHKTVESGICVDCEKDVGQERLEAGYQQAKDLRKYGP